MTSRSHSATDAITFASSTVGGGLATHLRGWKVLESRAILEVIRGRLDIVDKFHQMIVNDSPETAPRKGVENMHDLLADYPWLIHPEWQVLAEEKTITAQLREWGREDLVDPEDRTRYDFLALEGEGTIVVIEIKRAGHAVVLRDLHQLEDYAARLTQAHGDVRMVFLAGSGYAVPDSWMKSWHEREDGDLWTWGDAYRRTRRHYEHYRAVLEGDLSHASFHGKGKEVTRTSRRAGQWCLQG